MKMLFAVAAIAALVGFAVQPALAAESCTKECNLTYQACAKAHSQAACKTDRDICIKHCAKR